jgi:hypothetical protein
MAINQTASVVNLAKSLRAGLNPASLNTTLQTATVQLILDTLIDLGQRDNPTANAVRSAQVGFVNSRIAGVEGR